jgi:hypothetical protein
MTNLAIKSADEFHPASFHEIELADQEIFRQHMTGWPVQHSDFVFSNLLAWGPIYQYRWQSYRNRIILYTGRYDYLFMPIGEPLELDELLRLSDAFRQVGKSGNYILMTSEYAEKTPGIEAYFTIEADPNGADYIYETVRLAELRGKKLQKKKNLIAQFIRNNPSYSWRLLGPADIRACFRLAEKWCEEHTCDLVGYRHESSAMQRSFDHAEQLGLQGIGVFVGDNLVAFSVFNPLPGDMAVIHYEKYDREVKGSGQIINQVTAQHLRTSHRWLNREQDLGIDGLKQAKESYDPTYRLMLNEWHRKD